MLYARCVLTGNLGTIHMKRQPHSQTLALQPPHLPQSTPACLEVAAATPPSWIPGKYLALVQSSADGLIAQQSAQTLYAWNIPTLRHFAIVRRERERLPPHHMKFIVKHTAVTAQRRHSAVQADTVRGYQHAHGCLCFHPASNTAIEAVEKASPFTCGGTKGKVWVEQVEMGCLKIKSRVRKAFLSATLMSLTHFLIAQGLSGSHMYAELGFCSVSIGTRPLPSHACVTH